MAPRLPGLITSVMIAMNHPQIDYYFFLIVAVMTIFYIVRWIKAKDFSHLSKALGFTIVAGVIGLLVNSVNLFSTIEYQKATIRGGGGELSETKAGDSKNGLTLDYAFDYSLNKAEPIVMMVPHAFGGSSDKEEVSQDESKAIETLRTLPKELQQQLPLSFYWGGIGNTSGPPYVGALICFLAIIGFLILDGRYKWWILGTCVLAILMSWGKFFIGFNTILYHILPLYNKFRAPSMILVIPQLLLPLIAVLTINKVVDEKDKQPFVAYFKKGLIGAGVVIALLFICYLLFDYKSEQDNMMLKQVATSNQPQLIEAVRSFSNGLIADRRSLMLSDIFRTIGFCLLGAGMLYLAIRKILRPLLVGTILAALVLIDLIPVDSKYLGHENYQEPTENEVGFVPSQMDKEI